MPAAPLTFTRTAFTQIDHDAVHIYGIPILTLMENAGHAVATHALTHLKPNARALVIVGPGNNGGDALVAARWLANARVPTTVLLAAPRDKFTNSPAASQLHTLERMNLPIETTTDGHAELRDWLVEGTPHDLLIDGLFGTGLTRPVEGLPAEIIRTMNASRRHILAIDIPSGLDADTGQPLGIAVTVSETLSFSGLKPAFTPATAKYTGKIHIAAIGIPRQLLEKHAV